MIHNDIVYETIKKHYLWVINTKEMGLGLRIKKLRELRNFTQDHVAREIGLDQSAYSRLEKGETRITFEKLSSIAQVLDVEPEIIFSFDENHVFNMTNQTGHNGYIINVISENERKLYEDQIQLLKDQITHLQRTIDKILRE